MPFRGFTAINLLGVLFVHPGVYLSNELMNHERIHSAQQREMLFVFFYLFYVVEWLVRLPMRGEARSLNLSNSVAVGVYEVLRQWGFPKLRESGRLREYDW